MRRIVLACLAAGLAGTAAPIPAAYAEPAFGGYSTEATATPIKIEVYEPTIPIPASPQAELDVAYTKVEAASGPTGKGVASWLWPGDPVGQGFKTFGEMLGLPPQLTENGYPIQVNSETPGEPSQESDEPFPGSLMRTSSTPKGVHSTVGWSTNHDVSDKDQKGGGAPGTPDLPEPPAPADALGSLGAAITGKHRAAADDAPSPGPGLPPELAALIDVDGIVSDSHTETVGNGVQAVATSKLSNVAILGGLITADSITVTTKTSADGKRPTASGVSQVTGLKLAGKPITVGRDGVRLADQKQGLPGLPDQAGKALDQLGIALALPKPDRSARGDNSESVYQGLQVTIDTKQLRSKLDGIPFETIIGAIPDEAKEVKSVIQAATLLSPKIVITAGNATSETSTVPKLDFDLPTVDPNALAGAAVPPGTAGGASTGGATSAAGPSAPPLGEANAAGGDSGDIGSLAAKPMSAGLPPLASIPGALMVGGFVIAAGVGWWLQKIGGLVLGGAGSCSHGLETGVPDLRRA